MAHDILSAVIINHEFMIQATRSIKVVIGRFTIKDNSEYLYCRCSALEIYQ